MKYLSRVNLSIQLVVLLMAVCQSMRNFGPNKPHMLFHVGDRSSISLNLGWGYWTMDENFRMEYQNTKNDLYAQMKAHNGENMFEEEIDDRSAHLSSNIKYQLFDAHHWETQINMKQKLQAVNQLETTWFVYASVENNDYRKVDHQSYSTYISLVPHQDEQNKNKVEISVKSMFSSEQTISLSAEDSSDLKVFGLTANISETYAMSGMARQFMNLVRIQRGQNVTRNNDSKIVEWENRQITMMKDKTSFLDKNFVVIFIYGKFKKQTNIFFTNSTDKTSFDEQQFQQSQKSFENKIIEPRVSEEHQAFIKHVVSNLYGGMAYYFGRLYTQNSLIAHSQDFCYSFTPSRLIFPRSFLWDDGFHQAVAINYDPQIVLQVLRVWINKIDSFGWIGREQIRGSEISEMMPDSTFVFQDWFQMNPPTLMLTVTKLISISQHNKQIKQKFKLLLTQRFYKLEQWYKYFKGTQSHETLQYQQIRNSSQIFYRWQCKDQCKKGNFMGSGLDDYPRRNKETQISKQHVDVVSWLYFFSDSLLKISEFMEQQQISMQHSKRRIHYYKKEAQKYQEKLYSQFLDHNDFLFKDTVVEDKDIFIQSFVHKIGYINLFPFFTGMLVPTKTISEQTRIKAIQSIINIASKQDLLFSEDGLRSLSISDQLYGTDDNYWRGAVWMPINYMFLRACKLYYWDQPKLKDQIKILYDKVRQNLINTVFRSYKESGYLYQNYYEGKGHRGFPFYGWTSLIVNIITQKY